MNPTEPMRITIEHNGRKYMAELPADADMEDIASALRGLLVSAGWNMDTVLEAIPMPE